MCGRYTLRTAPATFWPADQLDLFSPRFNIAPTDSVPVVRQHDGETQMSLLRWGLIPWWAKDHKIGYRAINARGETVREKPSFREAFRRRRCLVLADGYYEWRKEAKKRKQPFFIRMRNDKPFAFAGLWETWKGPQRKLLEKPLETFTIITTESNDLTADLHDRMPVIVHPGDQELWLDHEFEGSDRLQEILKPFSSDEMESFPVSTLVNKVENDSQQCIKPITLLF